MLKEIKISLKFVLVVISISLSAFAAEEKNQPVVDLAIVADDENGISNKAGQIKADFIDKPPVIDGSLADECWVNTNYYSFDSSSDAKTEKTEFAIKMDKFGLYVAVRCYEPDMSSIQTKCEIRDGLFEWFRKDDWIEILIDPGNTGYDYYWFIVNAAGMQTDLCCMADPDRSWDGQWISATGREKDSWTAEIFIPAATFNRKPITTKWGIQIARLSIDNAMKDETGNLPHKRAVSFGTYRKPATWPKINVPDFNKETRFVCKVSPVRICSTGLDSYGLQTEITNQSGKNVTFVPEFHIMRPGLATGLVPHGTGPREIIKCESINIPAGKTYTITAPIKVGNDEVAITYLALYDLSGNLVFCTRDIGIRPEYIIDGPGPEYNLYSDEPEMKLKFKLGKWGKSYNLAIEIANGNKADLIHKIHANTPEIIAAIDLQNVDIGSHDINVILKDGSKTVATRKYSFVLANPSQGSEVKVNCWNSCIMIDGKTFIPVGNSPMITHGLEYAKKMIPEMKQNGFNTMHLWGGYLTKDKAVKKVPELDFETLNACFDAAAKSGMKVIVSIGTLTQNNPASPFCKFTLTDQKRLEIISRIVLALRRQPELIGYEIADEPEFFVAPEWLEQVYRHIKSLDPHHLVMINCCRGARSNLTYLRASDIGGIDYYPIGKWPADSIGPLVSELSSFAQYKPVKVWVQGYKIFNPRSPTSQELIMMTYSAIARGSTAIFYFVGRPEKSLWEAQGKCAREIIALTPALSTYHRTTLSSESDGPEVYASLRYDDNAIWIISVNESNKSGKSKIILPFSSLPGKAQVLFETRNVEIISNAIADFFGPFEKHVYKITLNKPQAVKINDSKHTK